MSADPDVCVPQTLTDFIFDLYDSVTLSQLTEEQSRLYNTLFRELSQKYFANTPWPSPQSIANECNGDPLFLAIYRELTHRHWHAVSRPSLRDRMEGWDVYRELFEELLMDAESNAFDTSGKPPNLFILPQWAFDILHEFVYQFQGFCQFRTTLYASATKHKLIGELDPKPGEVILGEGNLPIEQTTQGMNQQGKGGKPPHHVVENLAIMQQDHIDLVEGGSVSEVWNVESVLGYLQRLVAIGTDPRCTVPAYQYFGIFASVTLSRLECLLSDYTACLQSAVPLTTPGLVVKKSDLPTKTYMEVVHSVFPARLSLAYHMGISFLMIRQYKNAVVTIGTLCSYMQRGFKTGQLRKLPNSDQLFKNYDRMIALLALVQYLCPAAVSAGIIEESILRVIRDKHGSQLSKEAFADLFMFCSPKFISPAIPNYHEVGFPLENAYKHQVKLLDDELKCHSTFKQLRSYLKLYTSLEIAKLESFGINDGDSKSSKVMEETTLASMKLVERQLENPADGETGEPELKSALDIHYYIQDGIIQIDNAEKHTRRFENYFLNQMEQSYDIRKDVHNISTDV